ncbi:MAG: ABC transporter substrate-binding protein, partial [Bacteroidota bacterium]
MNIIKECLPKVFLAGVLLLPVFFFSACQPVPQEPASSQKEWLYEPQFAQGFLLEKADSITLLHFLRHYEAHQDTLSYALVPQGVAVPSQWQGLPHIQTPVQRMALMSSTHTAMAEMLGAREAIVAISQADYIWSDTLRQGVSSGKIQEVGGEDQMNLERVLMLQPQLVMVSAFPQATPREWQPLAAAGIPMLPNAEWLEASLLGRAEWLMVMAALVDKVEEGETYLQGVIARYLTLSEKARAA